MAVAVRVELLGYRSVHGKLARSIQRLQTQRLAELREESRALWKTMQDEAPERSGEFKRGISYTTTHGRDRTRVTYYVKGPHAFLLPIIRFGSKPHIIPKGGSAAQMKKGYPLRFFWEKGPRGPGIYFFWSVNHPGTEPNDFVQRALDLRQSAFEYRAEKIARSVVWME